MIGLIVFIIVALFVWGCESGNQANATYYHKQDAMQRNAYTYKDGNVDRLLDTGEKVSVVGNKIYNRQGLVVDIDEANRLKQIERLDEMCKGKYNFRPVVLPPSMYKYETHRVNGWMVPVLRDENDKMFVFERDASFDPKQLEYTSRGIRLNPITTHYYRRRYVRRLLKSPQMVELDYRGDTVEKFDYDINMEMTKMRIEARRFLRDVR